MTRGDCLEFRDFGVFDVVHRKKKIDRKSKKPNISIIILPQKVVKYTPGKKIKDSLI